MKRADAVKWIKERKGLMFRVKFKKRTDNTIREMTARTGVKAKLHGGEPAYDFNEYGLIPVFDMQIGQYRTIPCENITELMVDGEWKEVI